MSMGPARCERHDSGFGMQSTAPCTCPPPLTSLLTSDERLVIHEAGLLFVALKGIVGDGPTRAADLREMGAHVHAIQQAVMSNAAARAYPDDFRLLGHQGAD